MKDEVRRTKRLRVRIIHPSSFRLHPSAFILAYRLRIKRRNDYQSCAVDL